MLTSICSGLIIMFPSAVGGYVLVMSLIMSSDSFFSLSSVLITKLFKG